MVPPELSESDVHLLPLITTPKPQFGVRSFHVNRAVHQQTMYMTGSGKTTPGLMPNTHLLLFFFIPLLYFPVVCLPSTRAIMTPRSPLTAVNLSAVGCSPGLGSGASLAWGKPPLQSPRGMCLSGLAGSFQPWKCLVTLIWGQILWELLGG